MSIKRYPRDLAGVGVLARGVPHPEGVVFDSTGACYTGTAVGDRNQPGPIVRIGTDGAVDEVAHTGGRVLGLAIDADDVLWACDARLGAVVRVDPRTGGCETILDHVGDRHLLLPNFALFDTAGRLFVSDSGTATAGEPTASVWRLDPDGHVEVVADGLVFANGLALDDRRSRLYVVETRDDRVRCFDVAPDGSLSGRRTLAEGLAHGPDGLALDDAGVVYVTVTRGSSIVAIDPTTEQRALVIDDPGDRVLHAPSNLAFRPGSNEVVIANLFGDHLSTCHVERPGSTLATPNVSHRS